MTASADRFTLVKYAIIISSSSRDSLFFELGRVDSGLGRVDSRLGRVNSGVGLTIFYKMNPRTHY